MEWGWVPVQLRDKMGLGDSALSTRLIRPTTADDAALQLGRIEDDIRRLTDKHDTDTAAEDAGTSGGDEMHVPGQGLVARSAVTAEDRQVAALMADEHPAQVYGVPHDLPGVVGERLIAGFRGGNSPRKEQNAHLHGFLGIGLGLPAETAQPMQVLAAAPSDDHHTDPQQLRMLRELVAQLQGEVRRLHARLSEVEPERRNAEQRLRNAAKLQRQTMQEEIDTLKGKLTRAKAEAIAFPKRIEELSKALAKAHEDLELEKAGLLAVMRRVHTQERELGWFRSTQGRATEELKRSQARESALRKRLQTIESANAPLRDQQMHMAYLLTHKMAEVRALESLAEERASEVQSLEQQRQQREAQHRGAEVAADSLAREVSKQTDALSAQLLAGKELQRRLDEETTARRQAERDLEDARQSLKMHVTSQAPLRASLLEEQHLRQESQRRLREMEGAMEEAREEHRRLAGERDAALAERDRLRGFVKGYEGELEDLLAQWSAVEHDERLTVTHRLRLLEAKRSRDRDLLMDFLEWRVVRARESKAKAAAGSERPGTASSVLTNAAGAWGCPVCGARLFGSLSRGLKPNTPSTRPHTGVGDSPDVVRRSSSPGRVAGRGSTPLAPVMEDESTRDVRLQGPGQPRSLSARQRPLAGRAGPGGKAPPSSRPGTAPTGVRRGVSQTLRDALRAGMHDDGRGEEIADGWERGRDLRLEAAPETAGAQRARARVSKPAGDATGKAVPDRTWEEELERLGRINDIAHQHAEALTLVPGMALAGSRSPERPLSHRSRTGLEAAREARASGTTTESIMLGRRVSRSRSPSPFAEERSPGATGPSRPRTAQASLRRPATAAPLSTSSRLPTGVAARQLAAKVARKVLKSAHDRPSRSFRVTHASGGDTGVLETLADHAPESELIAPDQQRLALRVIGADVATATAVSSQRGDMQYESGVIC